MFVRYKGNWYQIKAKEYEPEKQSYTIGWMMIKDPKLTPEKAYIEYFKQLRKEYELLYNVG